MKSRMYVTKAGGETKKFSERKLRRSLNKAGADKSQQDKIISEIKSKLYDGMPTNEIHKRAFNLLKATPEAGAARYKLKRAIFEMGPSGFPFEKYVSAMLSGLDYTTQINQIVEGHCVNHEIDVIAEKNNEHYMIECKFHNQAGFPCNVKVPLYIQSRFLDVAAKWRNIPGHANKFHQGWIVTNTRFTTDAIQFGECMGLRLIGWNYPESGSLSDLIEKSGRHPLTSLTTLTKAEKQRFLQGGQILCTDLCENPTLLEQYEVKPQRRRKVMKEAAALCRYYQKLAKDQSSG